MRLFNLPGKLLAMTLAAFLLPATASAETTLRYTDHEPLGGMRTQFIKDVFFPAVEKESGGRLKIADYWNGELATGYDALRVVGDGSIADIGIVVPEYAADELPLHQIFKSFPVGPTGDRQVDFFRRVYGQVPAFPAELKKQNVVNLLFATGYPLAFFSAKPIESLDDMKGKRWRTASFWHRDFLQNAGASPVSMPWGPEIFDALKAKTLDGLMVNVDSGTMLKVHEPAPYVLASKDLWLGHVYLLAMNGDAWNELAQEDRDAIQRAAETAYRTMGEVMDESFDVMMKDLSDEGATIRLLDDGEIDAFKTAVKYQDVQAAWVKAQEAKGVKDAGLAMEQVRAVLKDAME